ncbi:MAG: FecR family protein [Marinifilaceae bacterium]|jgi:ferric-dicitrate binding protein FerR (iron transport regulator)|nr:FecR family protein [Marinifilaceae bacterium]
MGKKKDKNIDWSLISKNIFRETNSEEKQEFETWLNASEKHKAYVEETEKFYALVENDDLKEPDIEKAIQLFKNRISKSQKRKISFNRWFAYAAAIIIPIGIVFLLVSRNIDIEQKSYVNNFEKFKPGSKKAELTLANGQVVNLEIVDTLVKEIDGTNISNTSGLLRYQANDNFVKKEALNRIRIPRGGEYKLILSDGTKVWLNSESSFTYPTKFVGNRRVVNLNGEAYFDVAHNKEKAFIVKVDDLEVKVLGTEFNVKAYPEENNIQTTLVNGSVAIQAKGFEFNLKTILSPSLQANYSKTNKELKTKQVKTEIYTSWKEGVFFLDNTRLEDFMLILSRWYDIKFFITNESIKNITFNGKMKKYENLKDIFNLLEQLSDLEFDLKDDVVIIHKKM